MRRQALDVGWRFVRKGSRPGRAWGLASTLARLPWLILVLLSTAGAGAAGFSEEEVRAVYLFNFAVFAEWPAEAFESPSSPFRYCALGSQAVRASLAEVLANERVGARALILVEAENPEDWRRCHVLYLGHAARSREREVLAAVAGAPVLTVGESEGFALAGGILGLTRKAGRLRTIINREAAERAGIQISSKLLRLATLVQSTQDAPTP
ncbi:YfiR family protein [Thiocystis violacea]|uniref:YfiR family protein n=1 Tax=Thiocystis violacea TaxID=13725 RepID=UPI001906B3FB|nr:YfiR family protein [Thiocystis violacea]MBK1716603.1 hypothetical protein [Thiocystis violacea]